MCPQLRVRAARGTPSRPMTGRAPRRSPRHPACVPMRTRCRSSQSAHARARARVIAGPTHVLFVYSHNKYMATAFSCMPVANANARARPRTPDSISACAPHSRRLPSAAAPCGGPAEPCRPLRTRNARSMHRACGNARRAQTRARTLWAFARLQAAQRGECRA